MPKFAVMAALLALCACKSSANEEDGGNNPGPDGGTPASCLDAGPGGTAGMILIPGGAFGMGCNSGDNLCGDADQQPRHTVTVCPFEIDRIEVTQADYKMCMDDGACTIPRQSFDPTFSGALPVTWITWQQADDYCSWAGKRLPTEAEWELAARGTQGSTFPWGEAPADCTMANVTGCLDAPGESDSLAAGASALGVLQLIGNVSEWVNDWYDSDYYGVSPSVDPQGPSTGVYKAIRGGSYSSPSLTILSATYRDNRTPEIETGDTGFRCAK